MEAPGVYIKEVDLSEMVPLFGDKMFEKLNNWKQEYLGNWWMEGQNKMRNVVKSDWNDIDKLFKEEL